MNDELKLKFDIYCRRLANSGWDDILERGMESAKAINEAIEKPGPVNVARAAMSVARAFTANDMYYAEVLDVTKWKPIFPNCVKDQLLESLEPHVTSRVRINRSGDTNAFLVVANGARIGWVKDGDDGVATEILAHVDSYEASIAFARDLLWKTIDPTRIVLSSMRPTQQDGKPSRQRAYGQLRVATDDLVAPASSRFADEYGPYLKKCIELNINRTILFYGIPGSGKSTISRTLCDNLGLRSLRVRVEDIGDLGSEPVSEMLKIFEPDVVIFDDLDRSMSQVALLETMENLHKRVRFVFATVNHIENLQGALLRPGRFDEIIEVNKLDEAAVRKALGAHTDAFDLVKDWPVAFINEYVIRRRLLGAEKALGAVNELQKRVERLSNGMSESDNDEEDE